MNLLFRMLREAARASSGFITLLYERFVVLPHNVKQALLLLVDLVSIPVALFIATTLRYGTLQVEIGSSELLVCAATVLVSAVVFLRLGLYRAIVRFMGHEAIVAIVKGVTISALLLALFLLLTRTEVPRSLPMIYWCLMLICVGGSRLLLRSWYRHRRQRSARRIAIDGAGSAGRQLLTALLHGEQFDPVLFIDDNPALRGRVINDVPVIGLDQLPGQIRHYGIAEIFLAMASIGADRRREITQALTELAVHVRTIPRFEDLVRGRADISEVQEITLEDLLGREPVPPRPDLLAVCIAGKRVMVTGAGGSIGSELCRQILAESPAELLLVDASEFALYNIERELLEVAAREGLATRIVALLGSVQDHARMRLLLEGFQVQTVYHAAAYKHVPLVEHNVIEGVRNNVMGTLTVARAAAEAKVRTFVLVSTDKAVRPTNVMGASKRVAEMVMQSLAAANAGGTRYVIVRFGNVIGSSGSVVPLFQEQIAAGGPVTVTHAEAERYFMTIPEAAQLVLQASAMGSGGDVFVLDMGARVRIHDLARRMIHLAGKEVRDEANPGGDIEIRITGLRPGEKLREELLSEGSVGATGHPMILRAVEECLPWVELERVLEELREACVDYDCNRVRDIFARVVRGFDDRYPCADALGERLNERAAGQRPRLKMLAPVKSG